LLEEEEDWTSLSSVFFAAAEALAAAALALAAVRAARTADLTSSAALTADEDKEACHERAEIKEVNVVGGEDHRYLHISYNIYSAEQGAHLPSQVSIKLLDIVCIHRSISVTPRR
jgi:hypothetical protein